MNLRAVCSLCLAGTLFSAQAETISCPSLSTARQVGTCPSEEELKYTFNGYCSDNARMYDKDTNLCTDYRNYRQEKNTAPWESGDGAFQAYVSCDRPAATVARAILSGIAVAKQGKITKVVCNYRDPGSEPLVFTYRTRAECQVKGNGEANCE